MKTSTSLLLSCLIAALASTMMAQDLSHMTYLSCDFSEGIPADFTMHDLDGQTLHHTMTQAGIKQGEAWGIKKESGQSNHYAMSACLYKSVDGEELRPADDWLVTPLTWIKGGEGKLTWRGISVTNRKNEAAGYEVLISTTGNNPEQFTDKVFATTEESIDTWTWHEVDLSQYAGQRIYIAFRNNSAKGEILGIDDIAVTGLQGLCNFQVTTGAYSYETKEVAISTAVTSFSDSPITHMQLSFTCGDIAEDIRLDNLNIAKGETYNYTFPTTIPVEYSDTIHYTVSAVVQDIAQDDLHCSTVALAFRTHRMTVVEEATGMWCSFCPMGIVAFETLEEKYPDQFIGLALHYDDLLGVEEYVAHLGFPDGLPSAWVNRSVYAKTIMRAIDIDGVNTLVTDNGGLETAFTRLKDIVATTGVFIDNAAVNGDQISIDATVRPAIDFDDAHFNIAFVIVEDNVWEKGYYQKNGFADYDKEYLPGWYEKPSQITSNFAFNHVVRTIYNNYQGIEGIIPTQLVAGEEYSSSHTFEMPEYLDINNVHVVAMVINTDNGEIMNACRYDLGESAVHDIQLQATQCYAQGHDIHVALPEGNAARINLYTATGQLAQSIAAQQAHNTLSVASPGIYIVSVMGDNLNETHKVIVR